MANSTAAPINNTPPPYSGRPKQATGTTPEPSPAANCSKTTDAKRHLDAIQSPSADNARSRIPRTPAARPTPPPIPTAACRHCGRRASPLSQRQQPQAANTSSESHTNVKWQTSVTPLSRRPSDASIDAKHTPPAHAPSRPLPAPAASVNPRPTPASARRQQRRQTPLPLHRQQQPTAITLGRQHTPPQRQRPSGATAGGERHSHSKSGSPPSTPAAASR